MNVLHIRQRHSMYLLFVKFAINLFQKHGCERAREPAAVHCCRIDCAVIGNEYDARRTTTKRSFLVRKKLPSQNW